jgi:hypothetical protein
VLLGSLFKEAGKSRIEERYGNKRKGSERKEGKETRFSNNRVLPYQTTDSRVRKQGQGEESGIESPYH